MRSERARHRIDRLPDAQGAMGSTEEFRMTAREPDVSGIEFVDCDLSGRPPAGSLARRREVILNGRHVKTVDVHAHCAIPEALAMMGKPLEAGGLLMSRIEDRLRAMDEQGIDVEALSINPYWYTAGRDVAHTLVTVQNEQLAEFCGAHSDRFVAFASVSLQHPDLAVEELQDGVKKYGLRGAAVGASVNGEEFADPRFHPFWAKAEELGVLIFIHPQGTPELASRLSGNGVLGNTIGNPLETTIALSHLIFEGTLDRFPGLKICAAHGGGYLPSYAARSDAIMTTFPGRITKTPAKRPTEYLRQLYYDSLVFTPEALRHLIAETGTSQIVMGTDYPFPWTSTAVEHILGTPELTDAERVAILGGTAAGLLGITP
jgi:aminocarboxymuconate-semialdehyde decarboxylase